MRWKRILRWGSLIVGSLALLVGLGVFFTFIGLDKWASVIGVFVALVGLALSAYGLPLGRRASARPADAQRLSRIDAGRDIDVVDQVGGSVRLGAQLPPPLAPAAEAGSASPPATPGTRPLGEQSVKDLRADGAIRIVRGIDGDVDINP